MTPLLHYDSPEQDKAPEAGDSGSGNTYRPTFRPKENNHMLKEFLKDETGAELAEYAVGVALLVAIGIVVYKVLGNAVNDSNSTTGSKIKTATYP